MEEERLVLLKEHKNVQDQIEELNREKEEVKEENMRFKAMVDLFDEELKGLRDEVKENREKL
jgi:FtsZ-binding cell division protein ZapB